MLPSEVITIHTKDLGSSYLPPPILHIDNIMLILLKVYWSTSVYVPSPYISNSLLILD